MAREAQAYGHLAYQLARAGWFLGLRQITNRMVAGLRTTKPSYRPQGPVPSTSRLASDVGQLLLREAALVRDGVLPPDGDGNAPLRGLFAARRLIRDLPDAVKRREGRNGREVADLPEAAGLPDYFTQNFHFQSGGYLTEDSAKLYDVQVETLFLGAANAMRRQALRPIADFIRGQDQRQLRLIDVACGTGQFLGDLARAYPALKATGVDLSEAYVTEARRRLRNRRCTQLITANGEQMPLADGSQDIATCIFLFHELPGPVRRAVTAEIARVLKPGGLFVFLESLQTGDKPDYDGMLDAFPATFHEPYYRHYLSDDIDGAFAEAGFIEEARWPAFLTKVIVLRKPGPRV